MSPCYTLGLCIRIDIIFSFLLYLSLLFSAVGKDSSDNHFFLLAFLFLGDGFGHCLLIDVINLHPIVLQVLYQI